VSRPVAWTLPDVLVVVVVGILGSVLGSVVVLLAAGDVLTPVGFTVVFVAQTIASLLAIAVLSRIRGTGNPFADVGVAIHGRDLWAILAGVGLQLGVGVVIAPLLHLLFPQGPPEQTVARIAGEARGPVQIGLMLAGVVVLAPVVEEMIYRGMLLSRLRRSMGTVWAVLAAAAVFAGMHLLDPNALAVVPGLFLIGVVLGFLAVRRDDLSLAILTHAGVNLTGILFILFGGPLLDWLQRTADQLQAIIHL